MGAEAVTNIHTCSYFCERPECIKAQRDDLLNKSMIQQVHIENLEILLRDWQQWAEWFAGVYGQPYTPIQALKARTQEVLKP
jgi:hypothetical protein